MVGDMKRVLYLCAAALFGSMAEAQAISNPEFDCMGDRTSQVALEATGETMTVVSRMSPDARFGSDGDVIGYDWPVFHQQIVRADGVVLINYEARRLYDDVVEISCEARLDAAHTELRDTLMRARRLNTDDDRIMSQAVRMGQLTACLRNADACNVEPHYVTPSDALRRYGADRFEELVNGAPIMISVYETAYSLATYAYEPETEFVLLVETESR